MIDNLLLLSGNDLPFPEAAITIHHPTLREIAYVGEDNFFNGYQLLNISKNLLTDEDKSNLDDLTNFDILIAILGERNAVMQKNRNCVKMVLALLFPTCSVEIGANIILTNDEGQHILNKYNFDSFQAIIKKMFTFGEPEEGTQTNFNPDGELAKKIADKLKKRHQKLAEKNNEEATNFIGRYVSIISVGLQQDINTIFNYTLYQLFDTIRRYQLKEGYDIYIKAKMAGAQDLKEPEDWMKEIHH